PLASSPAEPPGWESRPPVSRDHGCTSATELRLPVISIVLPGAHSSAASAAAPMQAVPRGIVNPSTTVRCNVLVGLMFSSVVLLPYLRQGAHPCCIPRARGPGSCAPGRRLAFLCLAPCPLVSGERQGPRASDLAPAHRRVDVPQPSRP